MILPFIENIISRFLLLHFLLLCVGGASWVLLPVSCLQAEPDVVPQTDLVPTLALLLGVPIPYSSVGQVLLPVFHAEGVAGGLSQLDALWINAKQVGAAGLGRRHAALSNRVFCR